MGLIRQESVIMKLLMRALTPLLILGVIFFMTTRPVYAVSTIALVGAAGFNNTTGTALSFSSVNCTGSNTLGIITGSGGVTNDNWTSVTWGGQAMTQVTTQRHIPSDRWYYEYYINNPPTGVQTIVINGTPSDNISANNACYSGVATGGPEAASSSIASAVTTYTVSAITVTNNAWVIGLIDDRLTDGGCSNAHLTTGTNDITNGATNIAHNGPITPAASASLVCNTGTPSDSFAGVIGVFAPAPAATSWLLWFFTPGF